MVSVLSKSHSPLSICKGKVLYLRKYTPKAYRCQGLFPDRMSLHIFPLFWRNFFEESSEREMDHGHGADPTHTGHRPGGLRRSPGPAAPAGGDVLCPPGRPGIQGPPFPAPAAVRALPGPGRGPREHRGVAGGQLVSGPAGGSRRLRGPGGVRAAPGLPGGERPGLPVPRADPGRGRRGGSAALPPLSGWGTTVLHSHPPGTGAVHAGAPLRHGGGPGTGEP